MEILIFSAVLLLVFTSFSYFLYKKESVKVSQDTNVKIQALETQIERLKEDNQHLRKDLNILVSDNHNLVNAMSKWEIVSYENMTKMIFSSYMATRSPETSGEAIISAIEKRIK